MSTPFDIAWERTGRAEGGYADHPKDSGGPTHWGISERIARANGYKGDMRALTRIEARAIAKAQYWDVLRLDQVALIAEPIAVELFDTGFLCGPGPAARFLQRALNACNREQADYGDVNVDGVLGPVTIAALGACFAKRGPHLTVVLLRALNGQLVCHLLDLVERRQKDEAFFVGWIAQRVG